jgi:hypothetical protein
VLAAAKTAGLCRFDLGHQVTVEQLATEGFKDGIAAASFAGTT